MAQIALNVEYVKFLKGDIACATMLSQIVYWNLPNKKGESKLRVVRKLNGVTFGWLAKSHQEWSEELGLSPKQARRCLDLLVSLGLIERHTFRFNGSPTSHIRLRIPHGMIVKTIPMVEELISWSSVQTPL